MSHPRWGRSADRIAVELVEADIEIGFNAQYLVEFLQAVGSEQVQLELKDAESQGMLRPLGETDGEYRYVVMPMRF